MDTLTLSPQAIDEYISRLTPRQLEVVTHIARGSSQKETAAILSISARTIRRHILKACKHIGAENQMQLVAVLVAWKYLATPVPGNSAATWVFEKGNITSPVIKG